MNHPPDDDLDDLSLEEAAAAGPDLPPLLRYVFRTAEPLSDVEHKQIVPRVRERLLRADLEVLLDEVLLDQEEQGSPLADELVAARRQPVRAPAVTRRRSGVLRVLSTLAAVLVVGGLIGASLLLFTHAPRSTTLVKEGPPVTIQAAHDGLDASMTLTGGPYFLSETLAVDLTLTNHTQTTLILSGTAIDTACPTIMGVTMTGGGPPRYSFLYYDEGALGCQISPYGTPVKPGQTVTFQHYQTLTASGKVTLTEWAFMGPSSLDGYWPTTTIEVRPKVPQGYRLSFKQEGAQVSVLAPAGARHHVLYIYNVSCKAAYGPGTSGTGDNVWQPLSTTTVYAPICLGSQTQWQFWFSAPGYATISGSASL